MAVFSKEAAAFPLPVFYKVQQIIPDEKLEDIPGTIAAEMGKEEIRSRLRAGTTAAVLVGSRGIDNLALIVRTVLDQLKRAGVQPFIIPAMGSHGGGVAENQQQILAGYGITESSMGVPVRASMDTIQIATSKTGIPVYADKIACSADYIIPINRIKVHTDFKGPIESGLCKMLVIGLGKHTGCSRVHQEGFRNFPRVIPEVAKAVLEVAPVPFGIGIIENGHDHTHSIVAVPGDKILEREPGYLGQSKLLRRLNPPPELSFKMERTVRYSDTDVNGHMNNTRYADVACDALGLEQMDHVYPSQMQINFLRECRAGQTLTMLGTWQQDRAFARGLAADGKPSFDVSIGFSPIPTHQKDLP